MGEGGPNHTVRQAFQPGSTLVHRTRVPTAIMPCLALSSPFSHNSSRSRQSLTRLKKRWARLLVLTTAVVTDRHGRRADQSETPPAMMGGLPGTRVEAGSGGDGPTSLVRRGIALAA